MQNNNKVEVLSTVKLKNAEELYKIVDILNGTLKRENYMFGLALDENNYDTAVFTIYRT